MRQRLDQLLPQPFRIFRLLGRHREYVLIDEALFGQCAAKGDGIIIEGVDGTAVGREPQEFRPKRGEESFQINVSDGGRFEHVA